MKKPIYICMNDRSQKVLTSFYTSARTHAQTLREINAGFAATGANMYATATPEQQEAS